MYPVVYTQADHPVGGQIFPRNAQNFGFVDPHQQLVLSNIEYKAVGDLICAVCTRFPGVNGGMRKPIAHDGRPGPRSSLQQHRPVLPEQEVAVGALNAAEV